MTGDRDVKLKGPGGLKAVGLCSNLKYFLLSDREKGNTMEKELVTSIPSHGFRTFLLRWYAGYIGL